MIFSIPRYKWALLFACLSMFVFGLADNIRGPLFPDLLHFFNLTNTEGSLTFALASTAAFAGNMLSAPLMRYTTLSQLLVSSILVMALGMFGMGISPSFMTYVASAIIFGFSLGLMTVVQNLIVAENVAAEKQPKSFSALHSIYGLSSLLAPLLASQAPNWLGDWRAAFFITAALCTLVFAIAIIIGAQPTFEIHQHSQEQKDQKATKISLFVIGGIFAFYVAAEILVSTRLALYVRTYFNMNLEQSSAYVAYFFLFMLLGRLFFAVKTFRSSLKVQMNVSLIASVLAIILGLYAHPFFLAVTGLTMAPFYPISVAYIAHITGIHKRKFITFALSFQSFCVISMHLGVGMLTDRYGLFYAFGVGVVSLLLSLICVNFHPKIRS